MYQREVKRYSLSNVIKLSTILSKIINSLRTLLDGIDQLLEKMLTLCIFSNYTLYINFKQPLKVQLFAVSSLNII